MCKVMGYRLFFTETSIIISAVLSDDFLKMKQPVKVSTVFQNKSSNDSDRRWLVSTFHVKSGAW